MFRSGKKRSSVDSALRIKSEMPMTFWKCRQLGEMKKLAMISESCLSQQGWKQRPCNMAGIVNTLVLQGDWPVEQIGVDLQLFETLEESQVFLAGGLGLREGLLALPCESACLGASRLCRFSWGLPAAQGACCEPAHRWQQAQPNCGVTGTRLPESFLILILSRINDSNLHIFYRSTEFLTTQAYSFLPGG